MIRREGEGEGDQGGSPNAEPTLEEISTIL